VFTYDATGTKLKKCMSEIGSVTGETYYTGMFEYDKNMTLTLIHTDEAHAANSNYSSALAVGGEMALKTGTNFLSGSTIKNTIKNEPNISGSILTITK
jgi:hypothetical protein